MSEAYELSNAQVFMLCCMLGALLIGAPLGQLIGSRMAIRLFSEELARARVEHISELGEKRGPFFVNLCAKSGVFLREFFLEFKLLAQELFLKSVSDNGVQKSAENHANNGAADACEKGFNGHAGDASRAKLAEQGGMP